MIMLESLQNPVDQATFTKDKATNNQFCPFAEGQNPLFHSRFSPRSESQHALH